MKTKLHIQLLGGFSISVGEEIIPAEQWKSRRAGLLVKLLALTPGHRLHREQATDILWPDSDLKAATNNFHQTLYIARQVLKTARVTGLVLEEGSLRLVEEDSFVLTVDVEQFETATKAALTGLKDFQNPSDYQTALALYKGDLLPDDIYEEWTIQQREALRQTYLNLLLNLARLHETRQDYPAGIATLRRVLSVDRSHEEAHTELMRLYALLGQRQQALRQYESLKDILFEEMQIEPAEDTARLYKDIAAGRFPSERPVQATVQPAHPVHNLPRQITTLIGRENEVALVKKMVRERPLVTLTGAGGVGKTRLAQQVAEEVLDEYTDGMWFVELAPLSDPELVAAEVASALGVREEPGQPILDRLKDFLSGRIILLVLDNCEHLLEACARLVDILLRACPQLTIMATCREPLGVAGERIFQVPSLAFPERGQAVIPERIATYPAVCLFAERVSQILPGYQVTAQNAGAVASICQYLDGIPLAIELAAARMNVLNAEELANRLDDAFHLLTGGSRSALPRHQTLRATIDWSYNQLSDKEALLLRRLTVFAGGWNLAGAEEVCAGDALEASDILSLLANLVNKSLVVVSSNESALTRYRMLETIRQYAREKLAKSGEAAEIQQRHFNYFVEVAESIEPPGRGPALREWRRQLKEDIENIRLALGTGIREEPQAGLRLASALWLFWEGTYWDMEGARWLQKYLDHPENASPGALRGHALYRLSYLLADIPGAEAAAQESLKIFCALGDRLGQGIAQLCLGNYYLLRENLPVSREHLAAALEILEEVRDPWWMAEAQNLFGRLAHYQGDITAEIAYLEKGLALEQEIGDPYKIAWSLIWLGVCIALYRGNLRDGYARMVEGQTLLKENNLDLGDAVTLFHLTNILHWQGKYEQVNQVLEEVRNKRRQSDNQGFDTLFDLYTGCTLCRQGRVEEGIAVMEQTERRLKESASLNYILSTQQTFMMELAYYHACLGNIERAESLVREFSHVLKDAQYQPRLKRLLGFMAYLKGDAGSSASYYWESLRDSVRMKWRLDSLLSLEGYAWALHINARPIEAASLLGSAAEFRALIGAPVSPLDRPFYDRVISGLKNQMAETEFAAAWAEGQAIDFDTACAEVAAGQATRLKY